MKPTCFVVMGYGEKTDPKTQTVYDLAKSYNYIIKPAAEEAGFEVIRSDEIVAPGHISRQMYKLLFHADLVICDLTTLNANALYEFGVRMAFRPKATIVIAAKATEIPFNLNQARFFQYEHHGAVIDHEVVMTFKQTLIEVCEAAQASDEPDSMIYSLFKGELNPPEWTSAGDAEAESAASGTDALPLPQWQARVAGLKKDKNWTELISVLEAEHDRLSTTGRVDPWFAQQLALATYKQRETDGDNAPTPDLLAAQELILEKDLNPHRTTDPETLGLWAAVHKRLADREERTPDQRRADLTQAIAAYHKGYVLRDDHYNGVNYAFLVFKRAARFPGDERSAIADTVRAKETWEHVVELTSGTLDEPLPTPGQDGKLADEQVAIAEELFWRCASLAQSLLALDDPLRAQATAKLVELEALLGQDWMVTTSEKQEKILVNLLETCRQSGLWPHD